MVLEKEIAVSTYLIDFENVKSGGLAGIDCIQKEDSVHLFWSKRENKISIEMMERIRQSSSEIVMHQAVTGERDALDHQLCSYLGFLAGQKKETNFVIISNDKAYDHLIEFWKRFNSEISIRRVSEISKAIDAGKGQEAAPLSLENGKEAAEENVEKTERAAEEKAELPATELENAYSEGRGVRNSRRRERGGKYLRGGRNSRNNGKDFYQETVRPEESIEAAVQQAPVQKQVEVTAVKVPVMEKSAEASEKSAQAAETQGAASEKSAQAAETQGAASEKSAQAAETQGTISEKRTQAAETQGIASEKSAQAAEMRGTASEKSTQTAETQGTASEKSAQAAKTQGTISEKSAQTAETPAEGKETAEQPVEAVKRAEQPATAFVVRGIRAGILVESGFTADGILEKRKTEPEKTEKPAAVNAEAAGKENAIVEATEEFSGEQPGKTAKRRTPRKKNEKQIKNSTASSEASMKMLADSSKLESQSAESTEPEVKKPQKKGSKKKETKVVRDKLEMTAETTEKLLKKPETTAETAKKIETAVEKTKTTVKKTKTAKPAAAKTQTTAKQLDVTAEKAVEPVKKAEAAVERVDEPMKKTEATVEQVDELVKKTEAAVEQVDEPMKKQETTPEKAEPAVEKIETAAERTENKKRTRRGRPPKKQPAEVILEAKKPATASDVMEKCEGAAEEKWAAKVAALINESRDKKELYAATVKLLGQEKGRTVYHAIKVLK